jgi:6,7-dimethyl-8-ribityllumazine synthase
MLKAVKSEKIRAGGARFAIVASQYNARYVDAMLAAALAELKAAGAREIQIVRVPGAYEIPLAAARLARMASMARSGARRGSSRSPRSAQARGFAIICLGVILRGETVHAAHIGEAVSRALMDLQLRYEVPVIHEVLLLENEAQARARCLDARHNRGAEAAQTALQMARVMTSLAKGVA